MVSNRLIYTENSNCRLCGARHETVNHIRSECKKFTQKNDETRHDCVGKVNQWELYKGLKIYNTGKLYIHK